MKKEMKKMLLLMSHLLLILILKIKKIQVDPMFSKVLIVT